MLESMFERDVFDEAQIRPLRRTEYERMAEQGAFEDEKVELLAGVIVQMSPQGLGHADLVMLLTELLVKGLPATHQLRPQLPFALSDYSMPEPDLAVIPRKKWRDPHPSVTALIIEVADSSLRLDRGLKSKLYAAAGVTDYWILDVPKLQIEVRRDPVGTQFTSVAVHDRFADLRPLAFPELSICLDALIRASS
jgi:Uma2 family endonuclease